MRRLILSAFLLLFAATSMAGEKPYLDPVKIFDNYYGTDQMRLVAEVSTSDFRGGRSMDAWVADVVKELKRIEYQRLESEIRDTAVKDDVALVHIRSKIDTIVGQSRQSEIFQLTRQDGTWLINDLEVTDEVIDPPKEFL